jgi:DNA topoisomerase VI subunit B
MVATLDRPVFKLSRVNEYFTEKELVIQFGYDREEWPIVLVKELIDNSLDACEKSRTSPRIEVELTSDSVSIQDNGDGLPVQALLGSLDYTIRASSNTFYVSPTRGQLGNALKLLWAAPFVAMGGGWVDVETGKYGYRVVVRAAALGQDPRVEAEPIESSVKSGTKITIHWDEIASYLTRPESSESYETPGIDGLCQQYAMLNPHLSISFNGDRFFRPALVDEWKKWQPWMPTSVQWYNQDRFKNLVGGYLNKENMSLRPFIANFESLSGTQKRKAIMERLARVFPGVQKLSDLENLDALRSLLEIMQEESGEVKPSRLGAVGKDCLVSQMEAMEGSIRYKKVEGVNCHSHPFVVEAAFGIYPGDRFERTLICGLNWSPTLKQPFDALSSIFWDNHLERKDPVWIVLNVTCASFQFTDKGKGAIALDPVLEEALEEVLGHVLKDWARVKKRQKRNERAAEKAHDESEKASRPKTMKITHAAWSVMEQAFLQASDHGSLPTTARQVMYKARPMILELTGGRFYKNSDSFTQRDLPDFMAAYPELTQGWDVLYDPRGNFLEPHSSNAVPLGTKRVREYLDGLDPRNCYQYALFIEKEGFSSLFQQFRLQEKWDIALMSTKGMSNTASRQLIEGLTGKGVTILVAHDFDRSGFSIFGTLKGNTRRYQYQTEPRVIDIGLRLSDVDAMALDYERQDYDDKSDPRDKLREHGATDAEIEWLCQQSDRGGWYGHRVELNAMSSRQLIDWIERKFEEVGVSKIIPDETTLEAQYIEAFEEKIRDKVMQVILSYYRGPSAVSPGSLAEKVSGIFVDDRYLSWVEAVDRLASQDCDTEIPGSLEPLIERFFVA